MEIIVGRGPARWVVLAAVAVVLLAACGDDSDDNSPSSAEPTTVSLLAGINDQQDPNIAILEFLPESVTIAAGSTVEWRFTGPEPHSVTFLPPGQ